jgi:hypothetical protein
MKKSIQNKRGISLLFLLVYLFMSQHALSQNVVVSGALAGNGSYADLNSAFIAINGGAQTSANINVSIIGSTTETASAILNAGAWTTLSITPSGGNYTITGNITGPLVDLNGADNVFINGLNTGGNALTISNTSTLNLVTSTIRLIGDATFNNISNCTVLGSETGVGLGVITFSTGITLGNSNNTITACNIGAAGLNLPANCLFSAGTATAVNTVNLVQNCNIYDFFSPNLTSCGVFISTNNSNWSIVNNKLYQTAVRTYTVANTHKVIQINSGNAYLVSNNLIGYASSTATGTMVMGGTIATRFVAIELSVASLTASSVQGNTISAITLTTSSGTATGFGILCGVNILAGYVNVGTVSGNLIGGVVGSDLINGFPTTTQGAIVGINAGSTGTVNIQNNYIGGCTSTGTTAAIAGGFLGINLSAAAALVSISNNTIGNVTPNNIKVGTILLTTGNSILSGINLVSAATGTTNITNNLIRNCASYGTGTGGTCRGIYASSGNSYSVTGNTIVNMTTNNGNANQGTGQIGSLGIGITAGNNTHTIANNSISNLSNTNVLTTAVTVAGISIANSVNTRVYNNQIYDLSNTGVSTTTTAPSQVYGVFIRGGTGTITIYNNMMSMGSGQTYNTAFTGICFDGGGGNPSILQIYHNTINITGVVTTGSQSTFGIYRGGFAGLGLTCPMDVRNNLITNTRSGGTGAHYAIVNNYGFAASSTGWGANASNNNVLNANPATVGWWTNSLTLAGWKSTSVSDGASYSGVTVNYVNAVNDLHLNMGVTPTSLESNGQVISTFTTDIDGQLRPGPAGSINGGAFASDIGADEFDGVFLDASAPVITYTALGGSCSTADRTFTATISDYSGVPATGAFKPTLYFRKNTGSYVSSTGVLSSGTASNGVWSFTISSSALGGLVNGDNVSYFVIAQDNSSTINITSNPAVGLVAVDVTSVTTPPTSPNGYLISNLAGTYTVGAGGTFTSLTAAANAYNSSCLSGSVTFVLNNASYSTAETYPIVFLNNPYASATNSLLIIPSSGNAVTLSPTLSTITSVIKFLDARYISVDGLNSGGSSISVVNSNTTTNSANIWLSSSANSGGGCNFITIKNTTLTGGNRLQSNGVMASIDGAAPSVTGGPDNDNITIKSNSFLGLANGILAVGSTTLISGGLNNWDISNNQIGPVVSNTLTNLSLSGIQLQNFLNSTITSNTISNVRESTGNYIYGLRLTNGVTSSTISGNTINGINYLGTSGYSGIGIDMNTGTSASNLLVQNNMVSNISGDGWSSFTAGGIVGVSIGSGGLSGGINFYNNSIALNSATFAGSTSGTQSSAIFFGSTVANMDVRNNIFYSDIVNSNATAITYAIFSSAPASAFTNLNYNDYYVGGTQGVLANIGAVQRANLSAVQTAFGQNLNSINMLPQFTSVNDLRLPVASIPNAALNNSGLPISSVNVDIDLQARSLTAPDIGADEFNSTANCISALGGTVTPATYSVCSSNTVLLNSLGMSTGLGTTYNWQISTTSAGTYTNVAASSGTNLTYASNLPAGTYYMVLKTSCANTSLTGISNEATVTVVSAAIPTIASTASFVCAGSSVTLTASGAPSYSWNTGSTASSIAVTPTATTVYTLTGITSAPCTNTTSTVSITFAANPTVSASSATAIVCAGTPATLTASGATTYSWSNSSTGATINPSPNVPTSYTVTGFSANGCSAVASTSINVNPSPTLNISGSSGICTGQTATLDVSGASTYTWNTGATTSSISDTPSSNTTYTVIGENGLGCTTTTTQLVTVASSLSITIAGPSTLCAGQTATLTGSGGVTYVWNGSVITNTLAINPTINTSYSIVGSSGSCSNSAVLNVTVNANPTVAVTGNSVICAGNSTTLTASGAATYSWNTSATSTLIVVSPLANTSYTVRGFNALGCSAIATVAVVSNTLPVLTIVPSATGTCVNSVATLTASGANTYTWASGPLNPVNTVTVLANTTYTVSGTNAANCVASRTVALTSYSLPTINIAPASSTVCSMSVANFTASGAASYSWSSSSSTGATVSYTPASASVYTVIGMSSQNCISSATVGVTTNSLPVINITPPSVTVCALSPVSFTASGASTYLWNNSASGSTFISGSSNGVTNTVVGLSSQGCSSSATVGVVNLPLPSLSITPSFTTLCNSSTGIFTVSGASSYTWENSSTATTVAITPTTSISYSVVGTGANGCANVASAVILTQTVPIVGISPATATVCPNTAQSFTASGALTYTWTHGGQAAATTVTVAATSVYSVSGENANGCITVKTVTVTTLATPTVIVTPPSASVCLNSTISYTASGAQSYIWSTGDNSAVLNPAATTSTVYIVTGTNNLGCKSTTTVNLHVWQLPVINISASSTTICAKELVTLTASGASTYTWFPFNVSGTTLTNTPVNTLAYIVYGDDVNGCSNTNSISIFVDKCTGIEKNKVSESAIRLYPNPSLGVVNIDFGFEGKKQIIISNSIGALVGQLSTDSLSEMINLSE